MNPSLIATETKRGETREKTSRLDCRPAYLACLVWTLAVAFVAPVPTQKHLARATRATFGRDATVAISGPSFVEDISKCDGDRRDLVEMLSASHGSSISDLSYGGQTLNEIGRASCRDRVYTGPC